jgi:hypothetical protein
MRSFFSGLCHYPIPRRTAGMLVVLAWTSLAQGQGQASQDLRGRTILFQGETRVGLLYGTDGGYVGDYYAGAGTIIHYGNSGVPDLIGFAQGTNWLVQGKYGIDGTGPENKGRLMFKAHLNEAMPYAVMGKTNIYMCHLRYLELTTVGDETNGYRAFATKAIAFDNRLESLTQTNTFKLPEGGQLVVRNGKMKIGDSYISPNYKLSGEVSEEVSGVGILTNSPPAIPKP